MQPQTSMSCVLQSKIIVSTGFQKNKIEEKQWKTCRMNLLKWLTYILLPPTSRGQSLASPMCACVCVHHHLLRWHKQYVSPIPQKKTFKVALKICDPWGETHHYTTCCQWVTESRLSLSLSTLLENGTGIPVVCECCNSNRIIINHILQHFVLSVSVLTVLSSVKWSLACYHKRLCVEISEKLALTWQVSDAGTAMMHGEMKCLKDE